MQRFRKLLLPAAAVALISGSLGAADGDLTNSIGMKLIRILPGSFVMGQDGPATDYQMTKHPEEFHKREWDESPTHRVTLTQPFHLGATEVTLGQWREYKPGFRRDNGADDEAVRDISWLEANAFCQWLSTKEGRVYRLPTEAEWEYACRAGSTTLFHTGDSLPAGFQKWFRDENRRSLYFTGESMPAEYRRSPGVPTVKVMETEANRWGLFDMHGNVAEWCADLYGPYEAGEQTDPLGRRDGDFRVFRGGAHSQFVRLLRCANRSGWLPESRHGSIGFRVALSSPEIPK
jgi:formylglycine-generating enzyme required for sulfatase activity